MALNGQKASFLAGGEFPFPIVQPNQGFTTVTIQFKPFGVRLDFTGTHRQRQCDSSSRRSRSQHARLFQRI